jgi:hypothetical protein
MYQTSQYSGLESIASSYSPQPFYSAASMPQQTYTITPSFTPSTLTTHTQTSYNPLPSYTIPQATYQLITPHKEYHFQPDNFLKPRKNAIFVNQANQIKPFVEETFEKMFNQPFPNDVAISILNEKEFRKVAPHPSTVGVSFNRKQHGLISEIFVLNDTLGRVMLTLGHELGHVLTETLEDPTLEEAKAYSFSFYWMEIIKKHNVANLGNSVILENPALNGLHDKAFELVLKEKKDNKSYYQIYINLLRNFKYTNFFLN